MSWLKLVELINDQGDAIAPSDLSRVDAAKRIANLRHRAKKTAHKVTPVAFLPAAWWKHVDGTLALLEKQPRSRLEGKQRTALLDLSRLHLASLDGTLTVTTARDAATTIRAQFEGQPYQEFWDSIRRGQRPWDSITEIFYLGGLSPLTIRWRAKILMDWGLKLGIISEAERKLARIIH